jgi:hypothetical protein
MTTDTEGRLMARINDAQERILERLRFIEAALSATQQAFRQMDKAVEKGFTSGAKGIDAITNAIECIHRRLLELEEGQ